MQRALRSLGFAFHSSGPEMQAPYPAGLAVGGEDELPAPVPAPPRPARVLHGNAQLEVLAQEGRSDYLLVTFATKNEVANGRNFWADSVVASGGLNAIGFMPKGPNWFPAEAMREAIEAAAPMLRRFRTIVAYGQSMGAYAVLKYSAALGATHVLSFSPQYSIDPADVGAADKRFLSSFVPRLHGGMAIGPADVAGEAYVFYDPCYAEDRFNVVRILAAAPAARPIGVPMTAHFPIQLFRGTDKVLRLIESCIAGDEAMIRAMLQAARRNSQIRIATVCERYAERDIWKARRMYERRSVAFRRSEISGFHLRLADIALGQGDLEAAECALIYALHLDPGNSELLLRMSLLQMRRGDMPGAVEWARRTVAARPNRPALHNHLIGLLVKAGDLPGAEAAVLKALEVSPGSTALLCRLSQICRQRRRPADALRWAEQAVAGAPEDAGAHANLSGILLALGRVDEAEAAAQTALRLDPKSAEGIQRLENARSRRAAAA